MAAPDVAPDLAINVSRAIADIRSDLAKNGPPVEFQGSHDRAYRMAAVLRDHAISAERAVALLKEHWAKDFDVEWLAEPVGNAYCYGQNAAGAYALRDLKETFRDAPRGLPENNADASDEAIRAEFLSDHSDLEYLPPAPNDLDYYLDRDEIPALFMLVPDWIEAGIFVTLSGPGGTHKSRLLLQLVLCLLHRRQWLTPRMGADDMAVDHVEILSYENDEDETARRIKAMETAMGLRREDRKATMKVQEMRRARTPLLIVADDGVTLTRFGCAVLRRLKARRGKHTVLVLDSLFNAVRFTGNTKNNDAIVRHVLELLDRWCGMLGATVLAPFHPSRAGTTRGDLGYSPEFENTPRQCLSVAEVPQRIVRNRVAVVKGTGTYDLTVKKWNNGRQGTSVTLEYRDGILMPLTIIGNTHTAKRAAADAVLVLTYGSLEEAARIAALAGDERMTEEARYLDHLHSVARAGKLARSSSPRSMWPCRGSVSAPVIRPRP